MDTSSTHPWHRRIARGLQKALVAASLTLFVVCAFFWVRSYWWGDVVIGPANGDFRQGLASSNGWLTVRYANGNLDPKHFPKWTIQVSSNEEMERVYKQMEESIKGTNATFSRPSPAFGWKEDWGFQTPHWLPTLITGLAVVALGWNLQWRFRLRTMLIASTIVAVTLGMLVAFFARSNEAEHRATPFFSLRHFIASFIALFVTSRPSG